METGKVNRYECMFIETIWKMMQFYNVHLFNSKGIHKSTGFLTAGDRLYCNGPLQFKHKIEIYKYMRTKLATNPRINSFQYIIYLIRAFFEIFFTEKASKVSSDINHFICNHLYRANTLRLTPSELIVLAFGKNRSSLTKENKMLAYIKFKGYSVNYNY